MITVQETTVWDGNYPNHKYILSDSGQWAYGYIKHGEHLPHLFNKPIGMNWKGRKYVVLSKTKDIDESVGKWKIVGSKGDTYTVTEEGNILRCTCPASTYRHTDCKHIQQVRESLEKT
jgi:hypothetical protein